MDTVKESLEYYAYFNTYIGLFVGTIVLICAITALVTIILSKYKKSSNSNIDYYTKELTKCTEYEKNNNLCTLQLIYTDETNTYNFNVDPKTTIGNVPVFYQEKNPKSYMITPTPYIFPGICSIIACFILTYNIIRLIIIRSNKGGGAFLGGLDVINKISSSNSNYNRNSNYNSNGSMNFNPLNLMRF